MAVQRPNLTRPGEFGLAVAADTRRGVFDYHNEALLARGVPIAAVFIGDSITDMCALDAFFQSTSGFVVNRGIGGDRTPYVRRRFEADVLQLRPRLAVILIGVNNTWDLDIWWDPRLLRMPKEIEEEIVADTGAMVSAARAGGITVALCSILPTDIPFNGNTPVRNALIARANARLRTVAERHGAVFVDYHRHLAADDGLTLRPGLADDGLHPLVVGYELMAGVLLETLTAAGIDVLAARRTMLLPAPSLPHQARIYSLTCDNTATCCFSGGERTMCQDRAEAELERFKQDVAYYESHREELFEKYPEQWVAIFNRNVVGVAPELEVLLHNLEKQGISSAQALVKHVTRREEEHILRI